MHAVRRLRSHTLNLQRLNNSSFVYRAATYMVSLQVMLVRKQYSVL